MPVWGDEKTRALSRVQGHSCYSLIIPNLFSRQGAIGVQACASGAIKPAGLVLIDAVEGIVLKGIHASRGRAEARPDLFNTTDEAVRWALGAGGLLLSKASARLSIPMMLTCMPLPLSTHCRGRSRKHAPLHATETHPWSHVSVVVQIP